jgi:hypothetical protein
VGMEVELYSFFNFGARWGGWSTPLPDRFPPENVPVLSYRRLGELQGRCGRVRKISTPPPKWDSIAGPTALLVLYIVVLRLFQSYLLSYFFGT